MMENNSRDKFMVYFREISTKSFEIIGIFKQIRGNIRGVFIVILGKN